MKVEWQTAKVDSTTVFVLTTKQYERLSYNFTELLRWIKEAMWRLEYYGAVPDSR